MGLLSGDHQKSHGHRSPGESTAEETKMLNFRVPNLNYQERLERLELFHFRRRRGDLNRNVQKLNGKNPIFTRLLTDRDPHKGT
jgi:hypothetical protein